MANPVVHFEVPIRKAKMNKTKRFYEDVFGWKFEKMKGWDYWMAYTEKVNPKTKAMLKKGMINGGLMKRRKETGPIIVVSVKNIKSHIRKAEARGAKVTVPAAPMGPSWYARIKDPDGNEIALWQGK